MLTRQPNVHRVAKLVADATVAATQARYVVIWLTGRSGRLRRMARVKPPNDRTERDHVFASLVMERDEAVMTSNSDESDDVVLAAPIPGRTRPRGAIECHGATTERPICTV